MRRISFCLVWLTFFATLVGWSGPMSAQDSKEAVARDLNTRVNRNLRVLGRRAGVGDEEKKSEEETADAGEEAADKEQSAPTYSWQPLERYKPYTGDTLV